MTGICEKGVPNKLQETFILVQNKGPVMTDLACRIEEYNNNNNEGYNANDVLLVILRYIILCNIKLSDRHFQFSALLVSSIHFFSICHCASFSNNGTLSL